MTLPRYTYFDTFELKGHWWLPGTQGERIAGVLRYSGPTLELELSGGFDARSSSDLWNAAEHPPHYDVIWGEVEDGIPCTIYGAFRSQSHANLRTVTRSLVTAHRLLVGRHLSREKDQRYSTVWVNLTNLEEWLGHRCLHYAVPECDQRDIDAHYRPVCLFEVVVPALEATVTTDDTFSATCDHFTTLSIDRASYLRVSPTAPRALSWYTNLATELSDLLTLLIGEPTHLRRVELEPTENANPAGTPGENVQLFYARRRTVESRKRIPEEMLFSCPSVKGILPLILQNWFSQGETHRLARRLLFSTITTPSDFLDLRFLALTQAMETYSRASHRGTDHYVADVDYGRIQGALVSAIPADTPQSLRDSLQSRIHFGNEFAFRKRLELLMDSQDQDTLGLITKCPGEFGQGIRETRNYFVHHAEELRTKVLRGGDLHWACVKLTRLLTVLLLKDCGICEDQIRTAFAGSFRFQQDIMLSKKALERVADA